MLVDLEAFYDLDGKDLGTFIASLTQIKVERKKSNIIPDVFLFFYNFIKYNLERL